MGNWIYAPPAEPVLAHVTGPGQGRGDKNGNPLHLVKILIVGEHSFGKTSLLKKFIDESFFYPTIATIGIDFKIKNLEIGGQACKLQIWDTSREKFSPTSSAYRTAHGIILVFDITQEAHKGNLSQWLRDIKRGEHKDAEVLLVGTKCDLERATSFEKMQAFADENNITYIETSAKEDINVERAFTTLACEICKFPNPYISSAAKSARK